MSDSVENPIPQIISAPEKVSYRDLQYGKIYDKLEPNKPIDITVFGESSLIIDEENLDLDRVNRESLTKAWESQKNAWTKQCKDLGIEIDPFTVFTYFQVQRKAFQILGEPTHDVNKRNSKYKSGKPVPLSQMKGLAMCAEYASLETYIAQKIGEPARLIAGASIVGESQWREAHMFTWIDGINTILEGTLAAENQYPALMIPAISKPFEALEEGFDIECKRIGTSYTNIYGLEAGGFGANFRTTNPNSLEDTSNS